MKTEIINHIPDQAKPDTVYFLQNKQFDTNYYLERTNRNIGWLSPEEQDVLKNKTIGIAGCGGMGGLLAQTFLRSGVGTIKIADNSTFDITNINRQLAATKKTNGSQKALATAKILHDTTDDANIYIYPEGIKENTVEHFVSGCDLICDQIEFWAVGARILLHLEAYKQNKSLYNANTIGFGTRLFHFDQNSMSMEECLKLDYQEAKILESKIADKTASKAEKEKVMHAVIDGLMPDLPEYVSENHSEYGNKKQFYNRLINEEVVSILASNCPMAAGFLANQAIIYLLKDMRLGNHLLLSPKMPIYTYFDAAFMEVKQCHLKI